MVDRLAMVVPLPTLESLQECLLLNSTLMNLKSENIPWLVVCGPGSEADSQTKMDARRRDETGTGKRPSRAYSTVSISGKWPLQARVSGCGRQDGASLAVDSPFRPEFSI
jgi:hypothetical protein